MEKKYERFYKFSIVWGAMSSVVIFFLVTKISPSTSFFALKDLLIYLASIFVFKKILKQPNAFNILLCLATFFILVTLNYIFLNSNYAAPINNIRQILSPLILLYIYMNVPLTKEQSFNVTKLLYKIIIIIFAAGVLEQAFDIWPKLNLEVFFKLKGLETNDSGLSYMFYEPLLAGRERMTSTLIDPISLGHFFASAAIFIYYNSFIKGKLRTIAFIASLLGLCLALSKGAFFQLFVAFFILNKKINIYLRAAMILVPFILVTSIESEGIFLHINGLFNAIKSISLIGYGVGNAGNYAIMFGGSSPSSQKLQIGDTYVGALIGQIGLIGSFLWLFLALAIIKLSSRSSKQIGTAFIIFISIFTVSILSENTMNVTSFLLPAIMIGLSKNIENRNKITKKEFTLQLNE